MSISREEALISIASKKAEYEYYAVSCLFDGVDESPISEIPPLMERWEQLLFSRIVQSDAVIGLSNHSFVLLLKKEHSFSLIRMLSNISISGKGNANLSYGFTPLSFDEVKSILLCDPLFS